MSELKKGDTVRLTQKGAEFVHYKNPMYITDNVIPDDLTTLDFVVVDVVELFTDTVELKIKGDVDEAPLLQFVRIGELILMD